ncbi:CatA-like O-acetyltransferase [Terrisporobacter mayombei]|uniref:CatA-like O-acetyltransferase n=1 Tax=Terrisporobacter mayombei TaxID=1541 RepID=UPI001D160B04
MVNLDNELGYYEVLHPSYSVFHNDYKTISNMWIEFSSYTLIPYASMNSFLPIIQAGKFLKK